MCACLSSLCSPFLFSLVRIAVDLVSAACKEQAQDIKKKFSAKIPPALEVRYYFKVGFYGEMRGDFAAAVKYYSLGYTQLRSAAVGSFDVREIKAVAEVFNYKILYGLFAQGSAGEAVEQQQRHLAQYRAVPNDLQWAHFAWLSRQYVVLLFVAFCCGSLLTTAGSCRHQMMGELIDVFYKRNVGDDYLNPGYHFLSAALAARQRRVAAHAVVEVRIAISLSVCPLLFSHIFWNCLMSCVWTLR